MMNNTNLTTSVQSTMNAQNSGNNSRTASNDNKPRKKKDFDFKLSSELYAEIIKAEIMIMEKYNNYSKGMNKEISQKEFEYYLDKSPYRQFLSENRKGSVNRKINTKVKASLVLRCAVSCLYLCVRVKKDEMHNELLGRNILDYEHNFDKESDVEDFQVNISEALNGFTQVHYDYLVSSYPDAKNNADLAKTVFSDIIMYAARFKGHFNAHLPTSGSKKTAMLMFHLDLIQFIDGQKKVLVDVFSRTASIAFYSIDIFDEIHCGDKDKRFVNFFEMLRVCPVALVLRIRKICANYHNELLKLWYYEGEPYNFCNVFYEKIIERSKRNLHKASYKVKIDAAACLMLSIQFSYDGFCKDFNIDRASAFINNLDAVCYDLLYTSMILVDKDSPIQITNAKSRVIHKGIFKKALNGLAYKSVNQADKNTVSVCPISYEYWDFMKVIKRYKDNPNALLILDPPYPRQFMFPCGDYSTEFEEKHILALFRALKGAKCKAILFNSDNIDYQAAAQRYGFRLVGTYMKNESSTEVTQVYSLNIDPNVNFFVPDKNGVLY